MRVNITKVLSFTRKFYQFLGILAPSAPLIAPMLKCHIILEH